MGVYRIEEKENSGYWEIAPRGAPLFFVFWYPEPYRKQFQGVASTRKGAEALIAQFEREDREDQEESEREEKRLEEIGRIGYHTTSLVNIQKRRKRAPKKLYKTCIYYPGGCDGAWCCVTTSCSDYVKESAAE